MGWNDPTVTSALTAADISKTVDASMQKFMDNAPSWAEAKTRASDFLNQSYGLASDWYKGGIADRRQDVQTKYFDDRDTTQRAYNQQNYAQQKSFDNQANLIALSKGNGSSTWTSGSVTDSPEYTAQQNNARTEQLQSQQQGFKRENDYAATIAHQNDQVFQAQTTANQNSYNAQQAEAQRKNQLQITGIDANARIQSSLFSSLSQGQNEYKYW